MICFAFVITYPAKYSGTNRRHGSERCWHKDDVKPLYIQVHPRDNVAIIVNPEGLPAGTQFADGLSLRERIPQAHKVALQDLNPGDAVRRYGQIIGLAARPIAQGSWVHEDAIELPRPPALTNCRWLRRPRRRNRRCPATRSTASATPMAAWERRTFLASPPPCSAWLPRWSMRCGESRARFFRDFPR